MEIIEKAKRIRQHFKELRSSKRVICGFVPTMGALHEGHLSLLRGASNHNDIISSSIFVNPTQFNDPSDLEKYPRTIEKDIEALQKVGCDLLFLPSVKEIYPEGTDQGHEFKFNGLDEVLEGAFRPGHFKGVAEVVYRLLNIVQPDQIWLGQKDYQQVLIIKSMIAQTELDVEVKVGPIIRESSGLAMSSRNTRLPDDMKMKAASVFNTLQWANGALENTSVREIKALALKKLSNPGFKPEYFEVVDGHTLEEVNNLKNHELVVICTAVWVAGIRLIDNLIVKGTLD